MLVLHWLIPFIAYQGLMERVTFHLWQQGKETGTTKGSKLGKSYKVTKVPWRDVKQPWKVVSDFLSVISIA